MLDERHRQVYGRPLHKTEPGFLGPRTTDETPTKPTSEELNMHPLESFYDGVQMLESIGGRRTVDGAVGERMPKAPTPFPWVRTPRGRGWHPLLRGDLRIAARPAS